MKKILQTASVAMAFVMVMGTTAFAVASGGNGYQDPVEVDYLNFSATLNSAGQVDTSWAQYTGDLKYYKVSKSQTNSSPVYPDDGYIYYSSDAASTSYTDNDVTVGTTYYRVCAITNSNERFCSPVVTITKDQETTTPQDQYPNAITLTGAFVDGKVQLDWSFTQGTAYHGFKIAESKVNAEPTYPVMSGDSFEYLSDPNVRSYLDSSVSAGETHHYRVCVYDGSGTCLSYSNAVAVEIPGGSETDDQTLTLTAEANNEGKIVLNWEYSGTSEKGFKVAKSTTHQNPTYPVMEGDSYEYLSSSSANSFVDGNVNEGVTYHYRVCVYLGGQCGLYSNAVAVQLGETSSDTEQEENSDNDDDDESNDEVESSTTQFADVAESEWYAEPVVEFVSRGILSGYEDGTFKPNNNINRAEMSKVVAKYKNYGDAEYPTAVFCDVDVEDWFYKFVMDLYHNNVVSGYVGGSCDLAREFKPEKNLTRAEALKIILSIFNVQLGTLTASDATGFSDVAFNDWEAPYVKKAFELSIVNGFEDGTFKPSANVTRAEFVKMLKNAEAVLK